MLDRDFFLAGEAIFTVQPSDEFLAAHPDAKPHYTFSINRKEASDRYAESYFVSLLTGPDNDDDYTYIGKLLPDLGQIHLTRGSHLTASAWPYRILCRVIARIWAGEGAAIDAAGWQVRHCGFCGRCARRLTTPESLTRGIGPECWAKMGGRLQAAVA